MLITQEMVYQSSFSELLYRRVKPFCTCSVFYSKYFHRYPKHENLNNRSLFLFQSMKLHAIMLTNWKEDCDRLDEQRR